MENEDVLDFFEDRPKLFVNIILRWYPINLTILIKMLNSRLSDKISNRTYSKRLCKNKNIIKDVSFIEIALNDDELLFHITKNFKLKLSKEYINGNTNYNLQKLKSLVTEDIINKAREEELFIEKRSQFNEHALKNINWTKKLIDEYLDNSDLTILAKNENFPWTIEIVEKYKNQLGINDLEFETIWKVIDANKKFKWVEELTLSISIKKPDDQPDIENALKFTGIFYHLNGAMPWSLEMLDEYEYYWDWEKIIESENIWNNIFKGYLNDDTVLKIINSFKKYEKIEGYTYYFEKRPTYYDIKTKFKLGDYKGEKVYDVFKKDPGYINDLLESSTNSFFLSIWDINQLQKNSDYTLSEKAIKMSSKKYMELTIADFEKNKNNRNNEESSDYYSYPYKNEKYGHPTLSDDIIDDAYEGDPNNIREE